MYVITTRESVDDTLKQQVVWMSQQGFNAAAALSDQPVSLVSGVSSRMVLQANIVCNQEETTVGVLVATLSANAPADDSSRELLATIRLLVVDEAHRRKGLAQKMYDRMHHDMFLAMTKVYTQLAAEEHIEVYPQLHLAVSGGPCGLRPDMIGFLRANGWLVRVRRNQSSTTSTFEATIQAIDLHGPYQVPRQRAAEQLFVSYLTLHEPKESRLGAKELAESTKIHNGYLHRMRELVHGSRRFVCPRTATIGFTSPIAETRALNRYLLNGANHKTYMINTRKDERTRTGLDKMPEHGLLVGGKLIKGFAQYNSIHARRHSYSEQIKKTVLTQNREEVTACLQHLPGLKVILEHAMTAIGIPPRDGFVWLKSIHFFKQDESLQTCFDWHTDYNDLRLPSHGTRSVIVQLGAEPSTMLQVWGFDPFLLAGQGSAVAFHGGAIHRSIPWNEATLATKPKVWKMGAFFVLPARLRFEEKLTEEEQKHETGGVGVSAAPIVDMNGLLERPAMFDEIIGEESIVYASWTHENHRWIRALFAKVDIGKGSAIIRMNGRRVRKRSLVSTSGGVHAVEATQTTDGFVIELDVTPEAPLTTIASYANHATGVFCSMWRIAARMPTPP